MGSHLDIWNTSYGQKKGRESNWQFHSWPLKVGNRPNFLVCRWCATYRWKALDESYNFASHVISIWGLHTKLWGSKVAGDPTLAILGLPFGSPGTKKTIWMWALWRGTKYTIRGKVVVSCKFGPWWILWVRVCPWLVLAPKVLQLCTNHLVLVLCRSVWVVGACHSSKSHPGASARPSTPQNATSQGACPNSLLFRCFQFGFTVESVKKFGSVSFNIVRLDKHTFLPQFQISLHYT